MAKIARKDRFRVPPHGPKPGFSPMAYAPTPPDVLAARKLRAAVVNVKLLSLYKRRNARADCPVTLADVIEVMHETPDFAYPPTSDFLGFGGAGPEGP